MNGTWLAFFTLLMVVLIAVAVGAQQMEAQKTQEIAQLMQQRDETVNIALEAKEQREAAFKVRDEALAKVDGLNAQIASLKGANEKAMLEMQNAKSAVESRDQEIARLQNEANALRAQVKGLQNKNASLEADNGQLEQASQQIPVTCGDNNSNAASLPAVPGVLPSQIGLGLAVLIGMAALGSGGYIYYRHDPTRKYTVKMSKEQIRDYARYQRERGNRAG